VQEAAEHVVENVQEAAESVVENVQEAAEIFKDAITEEAQGVAEVFVEDLHEADEGDLFLLNMGLFRSLSILPGDVEYAAHHPQGTSAFAPPKDEESEDQFSHMADVEDGYPSKEEPPPAYIHRVPIIAYFLLMTAVVSLSSIGPLLDVQKDATPTSKIYWRMAGTAMLLLPFAAIDAYKNGVPHMNKPQWISFLLASFFYSTCCLSFVLALDFTSVGTAVILGNSQALLLLVGKLFVGDPVSIMEGSGAIVAFSGAVLCSKDAASGGSSVLSGALIGDLLAILSSLGGVGYLVFAKSTRAHMTLFIFMFLTMFVGCLMILCFQIFVMGEHVTFGMERETGVWSFLNLQQDRLPLELTMVVVCNLLGTMGYVRSMQYFDNLVISTAGLMEPVIAEFMAFSFGVSTLPGFQGWLGNALVAGGTLAVVFQSSQSKDGGMH
jgi:drug/metabolite transporter (DMT)-like permease